MDRILEGTTILDLTRFLSGPQATLLLAGLGADVIKVDTPHRGDPTAFAAPFAGQSGVSWTRRDATDMGIPYLKRARSKRSIMLNYRDARGKAIFLSLVEHADVVIDNFSLGAMESFGLDYEYLAKVNPKLIYCSMTGYGTTGPDRSLKAYDLMVQAAVGMMAMTGAPGSGPIKAASPMSDMISGIFAASSILAALLYCQKTGQGQRIDISMADCLFSLIFDEPMDCFDQLNVEEKQGSRMGRFSPFNAFRTNDGWVVLGAVTSDEWLSLLRMIGRSDLIDNPDYSRLPWRIAHNDEVDAIVNEWTSRHSTTEVVRSTEKSRVPCSPVRSAREVMHWSQLRERGMMERIWNPLAQTYVDAEAPGFPVRFSKTPGFYSPAPRPGEHTREVLKAMAGVSDEQYAELAHDGIVRDQNYSE